MDNRNFIAKRAAAYFRPGDVVNLGIGIPSLLETALRADIALTRCRRADPLGNLAYSGSSGHASHPVIATCGALSIVECDHFCDLGELGPDKIKVPGMFVDMILA